MLPYSSSLEREKELPASTSLESKEDTAGFRPFVSPEQQIPEFTPKAVLLGLFFVVVFGASSVYLALCSGFPVAGSIPISVIVIGTFKRLTKSTILENNLVQTIGSAGESIGSGAVFTLASLVFLSEGKAYFRYIQLLTLALVGGLLGILFMLPLRRSLIVKGHQTLRYPEGTACAEVLIAGERQGSSARPVFIGALVGSGYWILMYLLGLWKQVPYLLERTAKQFYPNAMLNVGVAPEYLGIGYLAGPRVALQILGGGLFAWLFLVPLFSSFPQLLSWLHVHITENPATFTAKYVHERYVRYIAVGAVVGAGISTLIKTVPIIVGSFKNVMDTLRARPVKVQLRTEKELPMWGVLVSAGIMVLLVAVLPHFPGRFPTSLVISLLIVILGFFFVTVASRFAGVAGYSIEPTSSIMITTVMITCLLFLVFRWTSSAHQVMVVVIGAVVCIAANNAGATSQDLKTGFLVGATPYKQQIGLFIGVIVSAIVVSGTLILIDHSNPNVNHAIGYSATSQSGGGTTSGDFEAPQATILATLVKAMLEGKVPWGLVLVGVGLSLLAEWCGAIALSIAAGLYFPLHITTALAVGSVVRWLITRREEKEVTTPLATKEISPGMLCAAGLVAGGSLTAMLLFFKRFVEKPFPWLDLGKKYWEKYPLVGNSLPFLAFIGLAFLLYRQASPKNKTP